MIPKSLPLWLAGDLSNLSTFSSNTNGAFFAINVSLICHHNTPFLPSMPFAVERELAAE